MSLQQAKKIAEIKEDIEAASVELGAIDIKFRRRVNEEIVNGFTQYLEENDFSVLKTPQGAEAKFKDLDIKLVLADEDARYIGVWHAFDIITNGKTRDIRIIPNMTGVPVRRTIRSGDQVSLLEEDLKLLREEIENVKLIGFKFDCSVRAGKATEPLVKNDISEVLDVVLS